MFHEEPVAVAVVDPHDDVRLETIGEIDQRREVLDVVGVDVRAVLRFGEVSGSLVAHDDIGKRGEMLVHVQGRALGVGAHGFRYRSSAVKSQSGAARR